MPCCLLSYNRVADSPGCRRLGPAPSVLEDTSHVALSIAFAEAPDLRPFSVLRSCCHTLFSCGSRGPGEPGSIGVAGSEVVNLLHYHPCSSCSLGAAFPALAPVTAATPPCSLPFHRPCLLRRLPGISLAFLLLAGPTESFTQGTADQLPNDSSPRGKDLQMSYVQTLPNRLQEVALEQRLTSASNERSLHSVSGNDLQQTVGSVV